MAHYGNGCSQHAQGRGHGAAENATGPGDHGDAGALFPIQVCECGNGILEERQVTAPDAPPGVGNEECDDGNNVSGDGCRADCQREVCGDGIVSSPNSYGVYEECDGDDTPCGGEQCNTACTCGRAICCVLWMGSYGCADYLTEEECMTVFGGEEYNRWLGPGTCTPDPCQGGECNPFAPETWIADCGEFPCTDTVCHDNGTCGWVTQPAGTPCGDACTVGECTGGVFDCNVTGVVECDDYADNDCYYDFCNPSEPSNPGDPPAGCLGMGFVGCGSCCRGATGLCEDGYGDLAATCTGPGDTWHEMKSCGLVSCSVAVGACCTETGCDETTETDCTGDFQGVGVECTATLCEPGGCSPDTDGDGIEDSVDPAPDMWSNSFQDNTTVPPTNRQESRGPPVPMITGGVPSAFALTRMWIHPISSGAVMYSIPSTPAGTAFRKWITIRQVAPLQISHWINPSFSQSTPVQMTLRLQV